MSVRNLCALSTAAIAMSAGSVFAASVMPVSDGELADRSFTMHGPVEAYLNVADAPAAAQSNAVVSIEQAYASGSSEGAKGFAWGNGKDSVAVPDMSSGAEVRNLKDGGVTMEVNPIPLPGAAGMALAGMGLIGIRRRR